MIQYKPHIKKISSIFFRYRNEIDIYTEDKNSDKQFYVTLLNRLLSNSILIKDVTPLGSKSEVINICKNDKTTERKKIYIIDGDLDLITDSNVKDIDNLYVLDAYCIENFLIEENGIIHLIYLQIADQDKSIIKNKLNFQTWFSSFSNDLIELFLHFAFLKKIDAGPIIQNIHYFFLDNKRTITLDIPKLHSYISEQKELIIKEITKNGSLDPQDEYNEYMNYLKCQWKPNIETALNIISGKDYLLPLVQVKIRHVTGKSGFILPTKTLKIQLADCINLDRLNSLKDFIISM